MNPESLWLSVGKGCSGFCSNSVWWNNPKASKQHNEPQNLRALTFRKFAESFCGKHQGWGKTQIVCIWKDLVHSAPGRQISLRKPSSLSSFHGFHLLLGPGWHHRIIATTHLCLDISQHSVPNQLRGGSVSAAWGWKKQPKYVYSYIYIYYIYIIYIYIHP